MKAASAGLDAEAAELAAEATDCLSDFLALDSACPFAMQVAVDNAVSAGVRDAGLLRAAKQRVAALRAKVVRLADADEASFRLRVALDAQDVIETGRALSHAQRVGMLPAAVEQGKRDLNALRAARQRARDSAREAERERVARQQQATARATAKAAAAEALRKAEVETLLARHKARGETAAAAAREARARGRGARGGAHAYSPCATGVRDAPVPGTAATEANGRVRGNGRGAMWTSPRHGSLPVPPVQYSQAARNAAQRAARMAERVAAAFNDSERETSCKEASKRGAAESPAGDKAAVELDDDREVTAAQGCQRAHHAVPRIEVPWMPWVPMVPTALPAVPMVPMATSARACGAQSVEKCCATIDIGDSSSTSSTCSPPNEAAAEVNMPWRRLLMPSARRPDVPLLPT